MINILIGIIGKLQRSVVSTLIKVSGPVRKTSGFRTARTFKICRTSGPDVMSGRALIGLKCICKKQKNQKVRKKKLQKEFLESHFIFDKLKKLKN